MARKVKGEHEAKEPKKTDKLWVPELDEMAKNVEEKIEVDKVSIFPIQIKS